MLSWQFIIAMIAAVISIANLTYLAWTNHDHTVLRTLSELAASSDASLTYFRWILVICGSLFGIAVLCSLGSFENKLCIGIAVSLMVASNMLIAVFPARAKRELFSHNLFAVLMAIGMIALAYLFLFELRGSYLVIGIVVAVAMSVFGLAANLDRKHYIYFELPYIFLSHISILIMLFAIVEP